MKILAPTHATDRVNDRVITGRDTLSAAYAVEVTANRPARLLLVNVDAWGYGYRLFPTVCRTGSGFDGKMTPAEPRRYPMNRNEGYYYLGLDEQELDPFDRRDLAPRYEAADDSPEIHAERVGERGSAIKSGDQMRS